MGKLRTERRVVLLVFLILVVLLSRGLLQRASKLPPPRPVQPFSTPPTSTSHRCSKVIDGDTIFCDGVGKIRLIGIDAPELSPAGGEAAARFLEEKISGAQVEVEVCPVHPTDPYGRTRAVVYLRSPSGRQNINEYMVANGYASVWNFQPCHVNADEWVPLEEQAKARKLGLWGLAPYALPHHPPFGASADKGAAAASQN